MLPTVGFVLWYTHHYWKSKVEQNVSQPESQKTCKVVFFPDKATAEQLSSSQNCESVIKHGSLSILMDALQEATKSLDVCMFTFSCKELGDLLIKAHRSGILVRVITDKEQSFASGSQTERLRKQGIQVRLDNSSYFMHHKFAVVDDRLLISGSLNWTLQGICGNQENIVISDMIEMVAPFSSQFEKLWELYDPQKVYPL